MLATIHHGNRTNCSMLDSEPFPFFIFDEMKWKLPHATN